MMNRSVMDRQMFADGGNVRSPDDLERERLLQKLADEYGVSLEELLRRMTAGALSKGNRISNEEARRISEFLPENAGALIEAGEAAGAARGALVAPFTKFGMNQADLLELDRANTAGLLEAGEAAGAARGALVAPFFPRSEMQRIERMMPEQSFANGGMALAPGVAGAAAQSATPQDAAAAASSSMDPAVLQQMLADAQSSISNLDQAEDFETVINTMRGNEAPLEERYGELAEIVGEEDASRTPESVLALVQPVMMMNAVDEGIGSLAREEMTQPVEGDMAGGIMSTVAQPPQEAAMMPPMGMGGPPPVNFNQGGLVRRGDNQPVQYFASENANRVAGGGFDMDLEDSLALYALAANNNAAQTPTPTQGDGTRLAQLMDAQKALYRQYGLGDPKERAAQREKDRDAMQAQILFDIAQMGLAYAGGVPGERRGMSPAERLAFAASQTKLPQTIAARVQAQSEAEKASRKEERAIDLAALQSAETKLAAEVAAKNAVELAQAKKKADRKTVTIKGQVVDITDPTNPFVVFGEKESNLKEINGQIVDLTDPDSPKIVFGTKKADTVTVDGQIVDVTDPKKPIVLFGKPGVETATINGQLLNITDPDNPKVMFGEPTKKTATVDGQIIDISDTNNPTVIFGNPKTKTVTLDGEVIDITDPDNIKVLYGDKKRDIRTVNGQLVEVTKDGTKAIFGERTPLNGTFENMILADGQNIIVKKVGETLYDRTGAAIDLDSPQYRDAVLVSKDKAFSEARLAAEMASAKQKLRILNQDIGDDFVGKQITKPTEELKRLGIIGGANASKRTFDALAAARKGVGFYNKLAQVFSEKLGAVIPALENLAADQVEAGNFIDAVNVLGRVALANSPRFAEAEQQRLANLFPSTDNFFANPANAVRRLVGLKRIMRQEYKNNLDVLSRSSNPSIRQQAEQQNYAIEGVLSLLKTIPDRGFVDETVFDATMSEIMKRRQERGAN